MHKNMSKINGKTLQICSKLRSGQNTTHRTIEGKSSILFKANDGSGKRYKIPDGVISHSQ